MLSEIELIEKALDEVRIQSMHYSVPAECNHLQVAILRSVEAMEDICKLLAQNGIGNLRK